MEDVPVIKHRQEWELAEDSATEVEVLRFGAPETVVHEVEEPQVSKVLMQPPKSLLQVLMVAGGGALEEIWNSVSIECVTS